MILPIKAKWSLLIKIFKEKQFYLRQAIRNYTISDVCTYINWRTFVQCLLFDFAHIWRRQMVGVWTGVYKEREYTMQSTVSKKEHDLFVLSLKFFTLDFYIWLISEWKSGCFFLYRSVCIHVLRNFDCQICWICCLSSSKYFYIETGQKHFAGQKCHLIRWGRTDL